MALLRTLICGIFAVVSLQISASAFTVLPSITSETETSLPVCAPNATPELDIYDDFLTCNEEVAESRSRNWTHPDQDKTTEEIIAQHGYSYEVHNITTHDGYILRVQRILGGPVSPPAAGKPSVYLNHGIAESSEAWLIQWGNKNLSDAGYDVWLGNGRGSSYSLGHETLNAETDQAYWDFSWHEMGVGDVPAVVEKILSESGNEKIYYVGYSMGTSQYFVGLSMLPELNDKIQAGVLLAPIAYIGHSNNPLRVIAPLTTLQVQRVLGPLIGGKVDFFKKFQQATNASLGDMCSPSAFRCGLCDNFLYFIGGFNPQQTNYTNLPNLVSKVPNNMAFKQLVHYSQSMNSCEFRQYDYGYGSLENQAKYGTAEPPKYNISRITVSTYMIHGDEDNYAPPIDVEITKDNMNPDAVKGVYRVEQDRFNHLDMHYSKDADILVFNRVLEILDSEESSK